jgi:hypothetical protein
LADSADQVGDRRMTPQEENKRSFSPTLTDLEQESVAQTTLPWLFRVTLMQLLRQYFYDVPGEVFVYFIMSWHGLFFARFWIDVKVMSLAMSQEDTSSG